MPQPNLNLPVIGWREWLELPDLHGKRVKAKVDTGARSSSLHASEFEYFELDGQKMVRFLIHPSHRDPERTHQAQAPLLDIRKVRSSSGVVTTRPVISTRIKLLGTIWPVELTLANRSKMGFRMLLGREAFRGRFLVDAGKSYFAGKPKRKPRKPA